MEGQIDLENNSGIITGVFILSLSVCCICSHKFNITCNTTGVVYKYMRISMFHIRRKERSFFTFFL